MDPLFALSIRQPWIDLILKKQKTIELRQWDITRLASMAYHAARRIDWKTAVPWDIKQLGPIALHSAWAIDWKAAALFGYSEPLKLPRGVIVGRTEILSVTELDRESWYRLVDQHLVIHPLPNGIYAGFLGNIDRLPRPIRCRGKQYFFTLSDKVVNAINHQLQVPDVRSQ